jgi:predicted transposase/invertase (TIGR01784 family)
MYVLKNLPKLQELPSQLQERIFEKIFRVAEIAKLNKQEAAEYEDSLKKFRDLNSALATAKMEGEIIGKIEGKMEEKVEIAQRLLSKGMSIEDVSSATGLSEKQVKELIK